MDRWKGHGWGTVAKVGRNATEYVDKRLKPGRFYAYRVFSYDNAGTSLTSAFLGDAVTLLPGGVAQASDLAATIVSPAHTIVQFTDNAVNELGYNVQVSMDGGPWIFAGGVKGTASAGRRVFDFSNAISGHGYSFRIAGYTAVRVSDYSSVIPVLAPVSGIRPAVLNNGKFYTFERRDLTSPLPATQIYADLMNADGTRDSAVNPIFIAIGNPVLPAASFGLPDGNIAVEINLEAYTGNHVGQWQTSLITLGESGVIGGIGLAAGGGLLPIGAPPQIVFKVGADGRIIAASEQYQLANLETDIRVFASSIDSGSSDSASGPSFPDSLAELPNGYVAAAFGNYVRLFTSQQSDPLGLTAPSSVTVTPTLTGAHLTIADVGTNETGILITRSLTTGPGNSGYYDFAHQEVLGVIPSSGRSQLIGFDDVTPSPSSYVYLAYPLSGTFIGSFARSS